MSSEAYILLSSQLPVGTISDLEKLCKQEYPDLNICFAYMPENLRLGNAVSIFQNPDRIVLGYRKSNEQMKTKLDYLFSNFSTEIIFMSIESAEMVKHAINSFLGLSITFINELAILAEQLGADAKQIELGLKSESRIGKKAYLSPGSAFAGGTLARDAIFLKDLSNKLHLDTPLIGSIIESNRSHNHWVENKLTHYFDTLKDLKVCIWGLTYKPGTNTLRRSKSIELCDWLLKHKASVSVYDPLIREIDDRSLEEIKFFNSATGSFEGSDVLIIGTDHSEFLNHKDYLISEAVENDFIIVDPNRFLGLEQIGIDYFSIGFTKLYEERS